MPAAPSTAAHDYKALALAMFAAMDKDGFPGILPYCTTDCIYTSPPQGAFPVAALTPVWEVMKPHIKTHLSLTVTDVMVEGNRVAAEAVSYGELTNGSVYNNEYHYKLVFNEEGKVASIKEYNNSLHSSQVGHTRTHT